MEWDWPRSTPVIIVPIPVIIILRPYEEEVPGSNPGRPTTNQEQKPLNASFRTIPRTVAASLKTHHILAGAGNMKMITEKDVRLVIAIEALGMRDGAAAGI